ncbi:MAG: Arm DNA-binding domain-containing protein [Deltaproteobacteria bacterium]|nr:Arm DNA-binding domain-containing protein [Deltaproteobacteria bacterium]
MTMTFGTYPLLSLKEARDKLAEAKKTLRLASKPNASKKNS